MCRDKLHLLISSHPEFKTDKKKAITEAFIQIDKEYIRMYPHGEDGSTAVIGLLTEDFKLYVAHVGMSLFLHSMDVIVVVFFILFYW